MLDQRNSRHRSFDGILISFNTYVWSGQQLSDQDNLVWNRNVTPKGLAQLAHQETQSGIFNMWHGDHHWSSLNSQYFLGHGSLCNIWDQSDLLVWRRWREGQHEQIWLLWIADTAFKKWPSTVNSANNANEALWCLPALSLSPPWALLITSSLNIISLFFGNNVDKCDGHLSYWWLANAISSWQQVLIILLWIKLVVLSNNAHLAE